MHFRPVTPSDVALLRRWDEAPHVLASDPDSDWEWETELQRDPAWREQWLSVADGKPIGFLQIIDPALEDGHYWGDCAPNLRAIDIWIGEADYLAHGYGTEMMNWALARCFARAEVQAIVIDPLFSNKRARRFYERFGFRFLERRQFGSDDCAVYRLDRDVWTTSARAVSS